ncbi:MAG: hypothetical protein KGQ41_03020 [Alphaproteobacteria bacterium]|nr:hypothetical protein [Alphaproteobacteria bacterium]
MNKLKARSVVGIAGLVLAIGVLSGALAFAQTATPQGGYTIEGYPATPYPVSPELQNQMKLAQEQVNQAQAENAAKCAAFYDAYSEKMSDKNAASTVKARADILKKWAVYYMSSVSSIKDKQAHLSGTFTENRKLFVNIVNDKNNPLVKIQTEQCTLLEQSLKKAQQNAQTKN